MPPCLPSGPGCRTAAKIPGFLRNPNVVLDVEGDLEIIAPIAPLNAIVRKDWVIEENFQAIEVSAEAVKNNNVGGDDQEIAGQRGICFVGFMKKAPCDK